YGTNSSTVIGAVEAKMAEINNILPEGVRIVPYYEQKTLVESCIQTVTDALYIGIVLVVLVLFAFMGSIRPSLVVAISIPFSILFAMIGMRFFNISANLMSFGGLAIAIGLMVDGTIVMVENIDRMLREAPPDESRLQVIARACKAVLRPIIFAISIIVVVFLPLFTLHGVEGKTFSPLAFAVALAMLGSLIFAVMLAPVLANLLMRRPANGAVASHSENAFLRTLTRAYRPVVTFFVKKRSIAVALAGVLVLIGLLIFPRLGSEFTPTLQEGTIVLRLTMAPSISLTESTRITQIVERRLMGIPEIDGVVTRIGRGEVGAHTDPINSAEMFILLKPENEWRTAGNQLELERVIRDEIGEIPGV
ncbi:MAG: efflux RND transporter permease subunit, partial [Calditrichaeota bacterium]|nr:efflux RND transporter permease subunit [Calditrichota bacterium]